MGSGGFARRPLTFASPPARRAMAVGSAARSAPLSGHYPEPPAFHLALRLSSHLLVLDAGLGEHVLSFLVGFRAHRASPFGGAKSADHRRPGGLARLARERRADQSAESDEDPPWNRTLEDLVDHRRPPLERAGRGRAGRRRAGRRGIAAGSAPDVRAQRMVPSLSPPTGLAAPSTTWLKKRCGAAASGRLSSFSKGTAATNAAIGIGTRSSAMAAPSAPKKPSERGQSISMWESSTCVVRSLSSGGV